MATTKKSGLLTKLSDGCNSVLEFVSTSYKYIIKNKRWFIPPLILLALNIFAPSTLFIMIVSILFYILFYPITVWIESIVKSNRLAVMIFIAFILLALTIITVFFIPALFNQVLEFSKNYSQIEKFFIKQIESFQANIKIFQTGFFKSIDFSPEQTISKYVNNWGQSMVNFFDTIIKSMSNIITRVVHIIVAFVVSLYLLYERKTIATSARKLLNREATKKEKAFVDQAYKQVMSYFSGITILSVIGFVAAWAFLSFIGLKFSLLLAIWTGIMEFIPFFGPILAAIPILIVAWAQSGSLILPIVLFFGILQFILAYIMAPQVLGQKTHFHPLLVLFIMFIGAERFGIFGMILSLPIVSLGVLFWKIYTEKN